LAIAKLVIIAWISRSEEFDVDADVRESALINALRKAMEVWFLLARFQQVPQKR